MAGSLIRGRRRWSVTYTSPQGLGISEFLEFEIEGHFRRENLTSFLVGWKTLLTIASVGREPTTSRTPRLQNKQGVPHPTRSAIGRQILFDEVFKVLWFMLLAIIDKSWQFIWIYFDDFYQNICLLKNQENCKHIAIFCSKITRIFAKIKFPDNFHLFI